MIFCFSPSSRKDDASFWYNYHHSSVAPSTGPGPPRPTSWQRVGYPFSYFSHSSSSFRLPCDTLVDLVTCHCRLRRASSDNAETIRGATVPSKAPKNPPFWARAFLVLTLALGWAMARRVVLWRQSLFFWVGVSLTLPFNTLKEHSDIAFISRGSAPAIICFTSFGLACAKTQRTWAWRLRLGGRTFARDFRLTPFMSTPEMKEDLPEHWFIVLVLDDGEAVWEVTQREQGVPQSEVFWGRLVKVNHDVCMWFVSGHGPIGFGQEASSPGEDLFV